MTGFQWVALALTAAWLLVVAIRFRRSTAVLAGGLLAIGVLALIAWLRGDVNAADLGLDPPGSWPATGAAAAAWLAVMWAWSPVADRIASRLVAEPPTLGAFETLKQSKAHLIAGIAIAWLLGGFLEELVARGIVLQSIEALLDDALPSSLAAGIAVVTAAVGAAVLHLYQGLRATLIIGQLSVLFGVLFVISGHNLWAVILCHGTYDTVAFVRFATGRSRYAHTEEPTAPTGDPSSAG